MLASDPCAVSSLPILSAGVVMRNHEIPEAFQIEEEIWICLKPFRL
jgi:hypothetical protein